MSFRTTYTTLTLVVGYFACAQYDVLFLFYVILNEVKNPTEELTRHILLTSVVGYFANAQYGVKENEREIFHSRSI